jgi:tetratricopeptide (TPR) repeat protein
VELSEWTGVVDKAAGSSDMVHINVPLQSAITSVRRASNKVLLPGVLILATLPAFLPILDNGFVAWDDDKNFIANPLYRGLRPSNLAWALTTFHVGVYQPLAWMLFGLEYDLSGLNPRGYHITSLVLHMAVGVSLYLLTIRLLSRIRPEISPRELRLASWLATALFVVHPLRVEVVAWVSCQGYLSCAWFAILAVLAYERSRPSGLPATRGYSLASLLCFVAALFCHATAIGLPFVLLILDFYPLRRFETGTKCLRAVLEKWPFLLIAAGFSVLGYLAKGLSIKTLEHHDVMARVGQASYATIYYLLKTMLPLALHAHHPLPSHLSLFVPSVLGALALTGIVTALAVAHPTRRPGVLAVWLSYLAILAPSSGLIVIGTQLVADRYSYLSSIPWSIMASYWLARALRAHPRLIVGLSFVVIASLSGLSRRQCLTWQDSTSLWSNVLAWDDSNSAAHLGVGNVLGNEGRDREALRHFRMAAKLDPASPDPYFNCAVLVARSGRLEEAQSYLAEALKRGLPSYEGMAWLALVLSDQGRTSEALPLTEQAIREAPNSALVLHTHGTVLARLGRPEEAIAFLSRAIALDPSLESPRLSLAQALSDLGRLDDAETVLRDVLHRNPALVEANVGLGQLTARRGDLEAASRHFKQALLLQPGHARAVDGLRKIQGGGYPTR